MICNYFLTFFGLRMKLHQNFVKKNDLILICKYTTVKSYKSIFFSKQLLPLSSYLIQSIWHNSNNDESRKVSAKFFNVIISFTVDFVLIFCTNS